MRSEESGEMTKVTLWTRILRRLGIGRGSNAPSQAAPGVVRGQSGTIEWEALLREGGVSEAVLPGLSVRLDALHRELGEHAAVPLLRAALAAHEAQMEARSHLERNLHEAREVERLLGAFSGELEKLDEVLEVLGAYAQRMRAKPAARTRQTLH
jgi:hypothetical protein